MKSKQLYIVYCIDTEGPFSENIKDTFIRLNEILPFTIKKKPTIENLDNLIKENKLVSQIVNKNILNYNNNFYSIKKMFLECFNEKQITDFKDSYGNSIKYNFFICDHVFYKNNPRKRKVGFHQIYNFYENFLTKKIKDKEQLQLHYHPHSITNQGHHSGTKWSDEHDKLNQILSRRVIDKLNFPSSNRAGFHVMRPDSSWFLEQYIPFDYSNNSMNDSKILNQLDLKFSNYGFWENATKSWVPYHPSFYDYEKKGEMNRYTARSLNIGTRYNNINQAEVDKAFKEANEFKRPILSFNNHDTRQIKNDIISFIKMVKKSSKKYPEVKFKFSKSVEAFRGSLKLKKQSNIKFSFKKKVVNNYTVLFIEADQDIFGPQPYFCYKSKNNKYFYDNLVIIKPFRKWRYIFNQENLLPNEIDTIGIAANNNYGKTTVINLSKDFKLIKKNYLN